MMKKFLAILLASVLAVSLLLTGCGDTMSTEFENQLKDDVYASYDYMKSGVPTACSDDDIFRCLTKWADRHRYYHRQIPDCGLVISREASGRKKTARSDVTYQVRVDSRDRSATCKTAAIALSVLADTREHGEITVLFTRGTKGAMHLPKKYLRASNFISLTERSTPRLFTGSAATAQYEIGKKIHYTRPEGNRAFRVSIRGCISEDSSIRDTRHAKPIVDLMDMLYECRSNGIVMQIASLNGGSRADRYPADASCVVTVNNSEADKLKEQLDNARVSYVEKNIKNEPDISCTIEEVKVPDKVFSANDTASVFSLMYTMVDGVYAREGDDAKEGEEDSRDGDITALANIGKVRTKNGQIRFGVFVRATSQSVFQEMNKAYRETAELSDMKFRIVSTIPLWSTKKNKELSDKLVLAGQEADLTLQPSFTFMRTDASMFFQANKDLNLVAVGITIQQGFEIAKTLVLYNESLTDSHD
jgi:hypothetical protein